MPQSKEYDFYFSLGGACACTQILRHCHLQFASYPFDWIAGSDIVTRAHIICNDFQDFLRKEALVLSKKNESPRGSNIWTNTDNGLEFCHDFHNGISFDEEYPVVYEKYKRRSKRLIEQIGTSKRVLAVYAERPCDKTELEDAALIEAQQVLQAKFPQVEIHLLYLYSDDSILITEARETEVAKGVFKLRFSYNMFNIYIPYEVNLPMAACALQRYNITDLHLSAKDKKTRASHLKKPLHAQKLIKLHKFSYKIARYILNYDGYSRLAQLGHNLIKPFFKKI